MDANAVQLLNLSPIPELSEVELSTMLEQLSAFSDHNSDITDRNIEDIIKEAEDLIDQSMSKNFSNLSIINKHFTYPGSGNMNRTEETQTAVGKYDKDASCENLSSKSDFTSQKNSHQNNDNNSPESPESFSTPLDSQSLLSPGSSNLIKSTIDSLREYSTEMEKQINQKQIFSDHSPTHLSNNSSHEIKQTDNFTSQTNLQRDTHSNSNQSSLVRHLPQNNDSQKQPKKFNSFESLYKTRPLRVPAICKNLKPPQKPAKFPSRRKSAPTTRTLKTKPKAPEQNHKRPTQKYQDLQKTPMKHSTTDGISDKAFQLQQDDDISSFDRRHMDVTPNNNQAPSLFKGGLQPLSTHQFFGFKPEEKLLLSLLQELKEIKKKIQPVGVASTERDSQWTNEDSIQRVRTEDGGVIRLEHQFFLLKAKYEHQLDKLERENERLKGALNSSRVDLLTREEEANCINLGPERCSGSREPVGMRRSVSLGNMGPRVKEAGTGTGPGPEGVREGFSQTERQVKSVGVECGRQEEPEKDHPDSTSCQKKSSENKENFLLKWKTGRTKPFLEASSNIQVTSKQRKVWSEHETQLMVTLRGVRAEALEKEKENRKLKTEVELLRCQLKRGEIRRGEGIKRCHTGAQTIGLGPVNQRSYDPRLFEGAYRESLQANREKAENNQLEKENEELKARIAALEDSFELLKEKRVKDLQLLHQVHEEEMGKLVSKLESQSALTKYLHSLLIRR